MTDTETIENTITAVESMDMDAAQAALYQYVQAVDPDLFQLGLILSHIKDNKWWNKGETFRDCVERFGIKYRKAMYLIQITDSLLESEVPWGAVQGIGWTKLKEIADVLTQDNLQHWLAFSESHNTLDIRQAVKDYKKRYIEPTDLAVLPDARTTLSLAMHRDQKAQILKAIEQAKTEIDADSAAVALEAICTGYLVGVVPNSD